VIKFFRDCRLCSWISSSRIYKEHIDSITLKATYAKTAFDRWKGLNMKKIKVICVKKMKKEEDYWRHNQNLYCKISTSLKIYEKYSVISLGVFITVLGKMVSPLAW
jgi:hypothetical protein